MIPLVSAADVQPDTPDVYAVAFTHGHPRIRVGDEVVVREGPGYFNYFVRLSDLAVLSLQGADGYVILTQKAGKK